jgi:predicted DCC family thiol-disulfide oxidoreductase YuxK
MNIILNRFVKIFKPWFAVDSRALGLFRIVFGYLCLFDVLRRWEFIDIFYTQASIIQSSLTSSSYKNFTLLNTFTSSWEVHLFFIIGIVFSFMLMIGYKTKFSQIMCAIIIISIHNRAIMLENAADFFMNCMLIWTVFLPLGISFSIDSLSNTLKNNKENSIDELNNRNFGVNKSQTLYSFAYFCMIYQVATIYFFTGLDKTGYDWMNGSAVYKMFQLDTFLTPVGYFLRDFITLPISKFFTYSTLGIEYLAPVILFFPFYSYILRFLFIIVYSIFHISIRLAIKVGLFSYVLMCCFILLIDKYFIEKFKSFILNRYKDSKYILFYDSDCGFCHYSIRVIKRLDIFQRLVFADKTYSGKKPKSLDDALDYTALLYNPSNEKVWLRHEVFGKILIILPFGFLFGWIFFIPGVSIIFRKIYDIVAFRRTDISKYFGLPACDLKNKLVKEDNSNDFVIPFYKKNLIYIKKTVNVFVLLIIFWSSINYSLAANDGVNDLMEEYGFGKNYFKHNQTLKKIAYYPRMIQRWNMFSPTVLSTDKALIIEATLSNGDIIDPFTGKKPVLDSVDYNVLWHDHNQFWRKFSSRVTKKGKKSALNRFETWLKRYNNTYFDDNLYGNRIREVNIWSLSQRNKDINSKTNYRVSKKLLNSKQSSKSKIKPKKVN